MKTNTRKYAPNFTTLVAASVAALMSMTGGVASADEATTADKAAAKATATRAAIAEMPFQTLGIGTQSGGARPAKMLITNEKEWRRVWAVHTRGATDGRTSGAPSNAAAASTPTAALEAPVVDFSTKAVVVLLMGEAAAGSWVEINQIVRTPSATVVFFGSRVGTGPMPTQTEREAFKAITPPVPPVMAAPVAVSAAAKTSAQPFHFAIIDKPAAPVRFNDLFAPTCPACAAP